LSFKREGVSADISKTAKSQGEGRTGMDAGFVIDQGFPGKLCGGEYRVLVSGAACPTSSVAFDAKDFHELPITPAVETMTSLTLFEEAWAASFNHEIWKCDLDGTYGGRA
jgi:hypothetical protein